MIIQHKGPQRDRGWTTDFKSDPHSASSCASREGEYVSVTVLDDTGRVCRILYTEEEALNLYRAAVGLSAVELDEAVNGRGERY
ncbi:hypothetical protein ATY81_12630 [Rhizobium sp. R72]|nr:hypothetical protein ATY81_12630 [Rhizobium sp. R72]OWV94557.1 hypothetical protein ATY80_12630 [Rhizobium sp. R711]